jgi:hypothetical protein
LTQNNKKIKKMKKTNYLPATKIIALAVVLISALPYLSNAQPFQKGTNVISAGIGFGGHYGIGTYGSQTPGISAQFEHGTWEIGGPGIISLGGYVGIKSYKYEYSEAGYYPNYVQYSVSEKWSYTIVGVRSAYHYNGINSDKFDVYGGLMLSDNILSYKYTNSDPLYNGIYNDLNKSYGSFISLTAFVGGRYFFTDNIGAFAELGYGVAYLNLGVAFKF